MSRAIFALVALALLSVCHSVNGQTWSIDPLGSSVALNADARAEDFDFPANDFASNSDGTFQTPFLDLNNVNFTIGENVSADAFAGAVRSTGASVVKANDGSALHLEWRAATDLDMTGDIGFFGNAHADLDSTLSVQLSGLVPGETYRISFDYQVAAFGIEEHESGVEDPVNADSSLNFTFGAAPMESFSAIADLGGGFPAVDNITGSGSYLLLATAAPVSLDIGVGAMANAIFTNDFKNPPRDFAQSEGFGFLDFSATRIPEPTSIALLTLASTFLALRTRRPRACPFI